MLLKLKHDFNAQQKKKSQNLCVNDSLGCSQTPEKNPHDSIIQVPSFTTLN